MADITIRRLDFSNKEDYGIAIDTMVSSFSVMPTWAHLYRPDDPSPAQAKVKYYLHAVNELGQIWATEKLEPDGTKVVESVIGFIPPGKGYYDASTVAADKKVCDAALGLESASKPPNPPPTVTFEAQDVDVKAAIGSSWNITLIGTFPSAAGRGLGTRLIQMVIEHAAKTGNGVWVPTTFEPRKRFYEKLGFEHIQTIQNTNDLGEVAYEYILYRRPS